LDPWYSRQFLLNKYIASKGLKNLAKSLFLKQPDFKKWLLLQKKCSQQQRKIPENLVPERHSVFRSGVYVASNATKNAVGT